MSDNEQNQMPNQEDDEEEENYEGEEGMNLYFEDLEEVFKKHIRIDKEILTTQSNAYGLDQLEFKDSGQRIYVEIAKRIGVNWTQNCDANLYYELQKFQEKIYNNYQSFCPVARSSTAQLDQPECVDSDEEGKVDQRPGGQHPAFTGEVFNEKQILLEKIGWGHFSTVWLTKRFNEDQIQAMKIQKSAEHYYEAAFDEINILNTLKTHKHNPEFQATKLKQDPKAKPDEIYNVELVDHFDHEGPHGMHVAMLFEVQGVNMLEIIKKYHQNGLPMPILRILARKFLLGLDQLHRYCKLIHTDLKPENVLLKLTEAEIKDLKSRGIRVEEIMKNIGHKFYTDPVPENSNEKEQEKDKQNKTKNLNELQSNGNMDKNNTYVENSSLVEPEVVLKPKPEVNCVDIDFDIEESQDQLQSTNQASEAMDPASLRTTNHAYMTGELEPEYDTSIAPNLYSPDRKITDENQFSPGTTNESLIEASKTEEHLQELYSEKESIKNNNTMDKKRKQNLMKKLRKKIKKAHDKLNNINESVLYTDDIDTVSNLEDNERIGDGQPQYIPKYQKTGDNTIQQTNNNKENNENIQSNQNTKIKNPKSEILINIDLNIDEETRQQSIKRESKQKESKSSKKNSLKKSQLEQDESEKIQVSGFKRNKSVDSEEDVDGSMHSNRSIQKVDTDQPARTDSQHKYVDQEEGEEAQPREKAVKNLKSSLEAEEGEGEVIKTIENPLHQRQINFLDEDVEVVIADLGNACYIHHHFTDEIQTRQQRSPEVIIGVDYNETADLWSLACMMFELLTGDFLFEPKSSDVHDKDDDHLAQMFEILGKFPRAWLLSGKRSSQFFDNKGSLLRVQESEFCPLWNILTEKQRIKPDEALAFAEFLQPMLHQDPTKRISALEALDHPWLTMPSNQDQHMTPEEYNEFSAKMRQPEDSEASSERNEIQGKNSNIETVDNIQYNKMIYDQIAQEILQGEDLETQIARMNEDLDSTQMADCSNVSSDGRSLDSAQERMQDDLLMQQDNSDSGSDSSDDVDDGMLKNNNFMMEMSMNNN